MRKDIEFKTNDGVTLRGWYYLPENAKENIPAIVMAHGYSAVKEMYLDSFAEVFCDAGFAVLVYDNRNLGASDGEPSASNTTTPSAVTTKPALETNPS